MAGTGTINPADIAEVSSGQLSKLCSLGENSNRTFRYDLNLYRHQSLMRAGALVVEGKLINMEDTDIACDITILDKSQELLTADEKAFNQLEYKYLGEAHEHLTTTLRLMGRDNVTFKFIEEEDLVFVYVRSGSQPENDVKFRHTFMFYKTTDAECFIGQLNLLKNLYRNNLSESSRDSRVH